ncbi:MAG: dCTP deaminase [Candidatus Lokiarchaeota archaeon]|nr:dCTP deaminase [Candidatus Lokiarchaeota archaeon]
MMLTSDEILKNLKEGNIVIYPFNLENLNPNSYDIRLGNTMLEYSDTLLDPFKQNNYEKLLAYKDDSGRRYWILEANKLYLSHTLEYTETLNLIPCLSGKSSLARLGLQIHMTAGFGNIGFKGYWTLEIKACQEIKLYAGMRIGQIYYTDPSGKIDKLYNGKYQGNNGVEASKTWIKE